MADYALENFDAIGSIEFLVAGHSYQQSCCIYKYVNCNFVGTYWC